MEESAPTFTSNLAVIYLARFAEGPKPVANFIESYNRHEAGIAHDRVVIRKGFSDEDTEQSKILRSFFPTAISVSDEGFDLTAFAKAAAQLPHKHVVFLNTFSEIVSDNWLAKLSSALAEPAIGIAGTTGSYESLHSSMKRLNRGLFQNQLLPSAARMRRLSRIVRGLIPKRLADRLVATVIAYSARHNRAKNDQMPDDQFEVFWQRETMPGGTFEDLRTIPLYPNPHIRTNGFIIERRAFLDTQPSSITTKIHAYLYESGPDSLTRQIMRRGKQAVIVGRDGQSYNIDQWPRSGTFRLGDQRNLLVQDNQTRAFEAMNNTEKRAFVETTWGDDHFDVTGLA
jgi:hypothetical protein